MLWIPSHMGIRGHDLADQAAKNSAGRPQEFIPIPYRDWIANIKRRMYELWEVSWREERRDLFVETKDWILD